MVPLASPLDGVNLQKKFTPSMYYREMQSVESFCAYVRVEGADKILDYYRASKGAFLCIQKNKRILHYGYIIKQSL